MPEDLTLTDLQGGTWLKAESLDEDDTDSVRLTIKPGQRGVPSQSISLYEAVEEDLATWLLTDLVDEDSAQVALTPEDHQVLADLGIEQRPDGKWGFKLKCGNKRCGNHVDRCFCADGLLEAVQVASTDRANTTCSWLCFAATGWLSEYLWGHLQAVESGRPDPDGWLEDAIDWTAADLWMEFHPHAKREAIEDEKTIVDALRSLTEAWRYDTHRADELQELREDIDEALGEALEDVYDPGAGAADVHPNACACPTGGGGA